jgi:hypothetical protein
VVYTCVVHRSDRIVASDPQSRRVKNVGVDLSLGGLLACEAYGSNDG